MFRIGVSSRVRLFGIALGLCAVLLAINTNDSVSAYGVLESPGNWPENWPAELEPFREKATSVGWAAGSLFKYHSIPFEDRASFEGAWPAILRLKTKGAPITLITCRAQGTENGPNGTFETGPRVHIICPTEGEYEIDEDGAYHHIGPWTDDVANEADPLPSLVVLRKSDMKWVDWNRFPMDDDYFDLPKKSRVEITIYVDGDVVDLNRIHIPAHTPIEDHRKLDGAVDSQYSAIR
jgi:hypothetical protein